MATRAFHLPILWGISGLPLKSMLLPTSSRSSLLWGLLRSKDLKSKPNSSSNRSSLILADSYATLLSFTFMMCNATQRGQLWIVADFPVCNTNKLAPYDRNFYNVQNMQSRRSRPLLSSSMPTTQSTTNKPHLTKKGNLFGIQPLIPKEPNTDHDKKSTLNL